MEYYKISENLKYACLSLKLQSIKTHPNTVNLNKQGTRQGTVNTSLRHKFGIPSCPQPGEQVRKRCPTTACSPVPRISSLSWYFQLWSSTHIQWSKVDRYISGRNSIRSNSNSFLPPILIICHRHSLTKLILITQLTQLIQLTQLTLITQLTQQTVTHSTHPNHSTHQTHPNHSTHPSHQTKLHSINSS